MLRRRHIIVLVTALFSLSGIALVGLHEGIAANNLPRRLSDRTFWKMVVDFSEPEGFFRSDNFISNETTFQEVIPELRKRVSQNGVYLGVGPDQNFTYVAALRPRMAFIVDIRGQNMLEHIMYKAIIEMSDDRADFLSRLFSRPRPAGLDSSTPPGPMFEAFGRKARTEALFARNLQAVLNRLAKRHGFALSAEERRGIEYVYRAFFSEGPDLRYSYPRKVGARWFPNYAQLMTTPDQAGRNSSYVATEKNFRALREHGAAVNYIYTSNVERYLFQTDA